ncbi:MAG: zinc metallopeptidase [Clostridia bacterium]|nr:zinc metallopeptidase [Clostridia bacterium]
MISFAITLIAQIMVKSRYNKYKQISNSSGINGENIARRILDENGMQDVKIIPTKGTLTDNYNPTKRTVNLSEDIFYGTTIAGIAVAAHECGHAIQHHENYAFLKLRMSMVPVLNITSKFSYAIIMAGYFLGLLGLFKIGIILESVAVLFHVVTLPVEFDASRRGLKQLQSFGIFDSVELSGCRKMLTAAALTYVGAALSAIVSLLRLILMFNNSRRRD